MRWRASDRGVPWSNKTSIRAGRWRFGAVRDELEDGLNLLPRDAEFFHQFVNAHVLKIFKNRRNRHPGSLKTHAPLRLPGTLSTAGHCDQSRLLAMIYAPSLRLS